MRNLCDRKDRLLCYEQVDQGQ